MPINASPEFKDAEAKHLAAETLEEKIDTLKEMISKAPKHKGAENLLANLRRRLKKLKNKEKQERKKGKKKGIKKQGIQVVLTGFTNSGKSTLLNSLTNAKSKTADYKFTTKEPVVGMLNYKGIEFQIIDQPAINYETFNQGLTNNADILLILIKKFEEIKKIEKSLKKSRGKRIILVNSKNLEKRKIEARLKSEKYEFVILEDLNNLTKLKEKLLKNSGVIRVYTKQPGKEREEKPLILKLGSTVKNVAEKIKSGLSKKIKETRITGPSSKFPNQQVGLNHKLKDKDIVEFHTR